MNALHEFIFKHTIRGECMCPVCVAARGTSEAIQPEGHTADVSFFKVAAKDDPDPQKLKQCIISEGGGFLFDGQEHGYMEIGVWIGDQGVALTLMGLGAVLHLWKLLTPQLLMPNMPKEFHDEMAGMGLVTIIVK